MNLPHSFSLRCAYPVNYFVQGDQAEELLRICCEHTHVIAPEGYPAVEDNDARIRSIMEDRKTRAPLGI